MKPKLYGRDAVVLEIGIGFGLAIAAGLAGGAPEMSARQIAAMIDGMGANPDVLREIARNAVKHSSQGRDPTNAEFRDAIASAVAAMTKKNGAVQS